MKLPLVFLSLLLPGTLLAAPPGQTSPAPAAAETATADLRTALIASLRADLLALRSAKEQNPAAFDRLGQAIDMIGREADAPALARLGVSGYSEGRNVGASWLALVQANGSDQSATLAARLAAQQKREHLEAEAALAEQAEALGKRAAATVFKARTAQELDTILTEITGLVPGLNQGRYSGEGSSLLSQLASFYQFLAAWQNHLVLRESGRPGEALQALRNLSGNNREVPWIPRSELARQMAEAARLCGKPSSEEVGPKIAAMVEKGLAAEKAETIDPLLTEARRLQALLQQDDSGQNGQRLNNVITFLERWQDLLTARAAGNGVKLSEAVKQLNNYEIKQLDLPRSQLLARIYALSEGATEEAADGGAPRKAKASAGLAEKIEKPSVVLERIKQLDDLAANVEALRRAAQLESGQNYPGGEWQGILQELQALAREYQQLQRGLATRVSLSLTGGNSTHPLTTELRQQLAVYAVQRIVGDDAKLPPQTGENALTYLRRLLQAGRERKDWRLVQRVFDTANSTGAHDTLIRTTDTTALTSFLAGLSQERARQFAFAVASYQAALRTGSEWVPIEEIGERLERIRKENATDYEQGVQWATNPPASRDPFGRPMDPRSGLPMSGAPNYYPTGRPPSFAPGSPSGEQPVIVPERKSPTEVKPAAPKPEEQKGEGAKSTAPVPAKID